MAHQHLRASARPAASGTPNPTLRFLQKVGLVLLRWWEEPVGVAVPLFALVVVLFAPQMPDMFAGMIVGNRDGVIDRAWWHPLGLGTSAALLGFSAWYWTRAALLAPYKIDDASRQAARALPTARTPQIEWSREWAPRVALLAAAIIAAAPLLMAAMNPERRLDDAPLLSVLVGVGFVLLAFVVVIRRQRWGLAGGARAPHWMWLWRVSAIAAAAPFGWPVAIALFVMSLGGAWLIANEPQLVEYLHAPSAAIGALALVVGPLVIALSIFRSLANWAIFLVATACSWLIGFLRGKTVNTVDLATFRSLGNVLGLAILLVWLYGLEAPSERFELRHGSALTEPWEACERQPYPPSATSYRQCIDEALVAWRNARLAAGYPSDREMPVVIVAAEGGASRSAAWVLSAFQLLDAKTEHRFGRFLFAISGVSGGSLGAVTYALAVRQYPHVDGGLDWNAKNVKAGVTQLAQGDLLASSIATYFLDDVLARLLRSLWTADDRGVALERAFERHWEWSAGFAIPATIAEAHLLTLYADPPLGLPHLFLNGTDEETGRRLITSSIRFAPGDDLFAASDDVIALRHEDVPISTAVTNSARFPFISPAGRITPWDGGTRRHVLDGGYFENYGARSAADLSRAVTRVSSRLGLHLVPIVVVISNDADAYRSVQDADKQGTQGRSLAETTVTCLPSRVAPAQPLPPSTAKQRNTESYGFGEEVVAPLLGLAATRGAHGQDALHLLRRNHCPDAKDDRVRMVHIALPLPEPSTEAAPLNWVLNPQTAHFLLDTAPELAFNQKQADLLAQTLNHLSATEITTSERSSEQVSR